MIGGGRNDEGSIWMMDLAKAQESWKWAALPGISFKRKGHSATQIGSRIFLFGGWADYKYQNDLHVFNTTTLTLEGPIDSQGQKPCK